MKKKLAKKTTTHKDQPAKKRASTSVSVLKTPQLKFRKLVHSFALKGDYQTGTEIARKALQEDPNEIEYLYQYAKLLGDWADDLPLAKKKRFKNESIGILKKLQKRIHETTDDVLIWGISLNYFYQREDFSGIYRWGKDLSNAGHAKAIYAQGVGASLRAGQLHPKAAAKRWAQLAVEAWENYGLKTEKYYFPHYCLALAQAVLGNKRDATQALNRAAKVSQRNPDCEEFKDVFAMIQEIKNESQT
ncbi:MAG: hypothetical protein EOP09_15925 [Proteobacteria bacterium]|nr:MAG: hypothetical protein EOP09_15925 [Pseudomonadota bacterium]